MAKSAHRVFVKMKSTESGHFYYTEKNKNNTPARLELNKFDPYIRKRILYRETK